jgi:hypothetical protein
VGWLWATGEGGEKKGRAGPEGKKDWAAAGLFSFSFFFTFNHILKFKNFRV